MEMTFVFGWLLFVTLHFISLFAGSVEVGECSPLQGKGKVIINNCPLPSFEIGDDEVDFVNIDLVPFQWNLNGGALTLQTKKLTMWKPNSKNKVINGYYSRFSPFFGVIRVGKNSTLKVKFANKVKDVMSNLHTHGLRISGEVDDISLVLKYNQSREYVYHIPSEHAGGTHWIHPHVHMSVTAQVGGGALGLFVVKDSPYEVPKEVLNMKTIELILMDVSPKNIWAGKIIANDPQLMVSDKTMPDFYTCNGYVSPIVQIERNKWTRLRILNVSPSNFALFARFTEHTCDVVLLAKDGVYLRHGARRITDFRMSQSSRVDIAIRCFNYDTNTIRVFDNTYSASALFILKVVNGPNSLRSPDLFDLNFQACLPSYLDDITSIDARYRVDMQSVNKINGQSFNKSFDKASAMRLVQISSNEEYTFLNTNHPIHMHTVHFQLTQNSTEGWNFAGEWIDTINSNTILHGSGDGTGGPTVVANVRFDRFDGKIMLHCHNLLHEDLGMMALFWGEKNATAFAPRVGRFGQAFCKSTNALGVSDCVRVRRRNRKTRRIIFKCRG